MRLLIFGECHAKRLANPKALPDLLKNQFEEIKEISFGTGRTEDLMDTFELIDFKEDDVFLIGGTPQERYTNEEGFKNKTSRLIQTIFTKFKNAKIIFWGVPCRSDNPNFQKFIDINRIKGSFTNDKNIFAITIEGGDMLFADHVHFNPNGDKEMVNQIANFVAALQPFLIKKRFELVKPENEMEFNPNKSVTFLVNYHEKIEASVKITSREGKETEFKHHYGTNVMPDRINIMKLKDVKKIVFDKNFHIEKCQIEHY